MTLIKAFMHVLLKLASRRDVLHLGRVLWILRAGFNVRPGLL